MRRSSLSVLLASNRQPFKSANTISHPSHPEKKKIIATSILDTGDVTNLARPFFIDLSSFESRGIVGASVLGKV